MLLTKSTFHKLFAEILYRGAFRTRLLPLLVLFGLVSVARSQATMPLNWWYAPVTQTYNVIYSPDGRLVAVSGSGSLQIYSAANRTLIGCLPEVHSTFTPSCIAAFSPDSKTIAVASTSSDGSSEVDLWDVATRTLASSFLVSGDANYTAASVAFSPDGKMLAVGGLDIYSSLSLLELWDVLSGKIMTSLPTKATSVLSLAFSPDSGTLAAAGCTVVTGKGILEMWNVATQKLTASFSTNANVVESVAFAPSGNTVAAGGVTGSSGAAGLIELWNVTSTNLITSLNTGANYQVNSVAFSPDGRKLVDCGTSYDSNLSVVGGVLETWNTSSYQLLTTFDTGLSFTLSGPYYLPFSVGQSVAISPDSNTIAFASNITPTGGGESFSGPVQFWNSSSATLIASLDSGPYLFGNTVRISPDAKTVAVGVVPNPVTSDGAVELWNVSTGNLEATLSSAADYGVWSLAFSPDGQTLAVGGASYIPYAVVVELWDIKTATLLKTLDTSSLNPNGTGFVALAFSPDGKSLAVGGLGTPFGGVLEAFDVQSGKMNSSLNTTANEGITSIAWSATGNVVADTGIYTNPSTSQSTPLVEVWDVATGVLKQSFSSGVAEIGSVAISPDGTILADGGQNLGTGDGVIEVWSVSTGSQLAILPMQPKDAFVSLAFTSDGQELLVGGATTVHAFGTTSFAEIGYFELFQKSSSTTLSLTLASDDSLVSYVNADGTLALGMNPFKSLDPLVGFTLSSGSVLGGGSVIATVSLSKIAPAGGAVVSLNSSSPSATVPTSVTVQPGATTATFPVITSGVNTQTSTTITAESGTTSKSATLTITPAKLSSVTLNPASVVGGNSSTGTIILSGPAGFGGTVISLSSNNLAVIVPTTVTVTAGQNFATFTIVTVGISKQTAATITGSLNGQSQTTSLTLTTPVLAMVSVTPSIVLGGANSTGTVVLNGPAGSGGVVVSLSSNGTSATVPKSIKIASGNASATFSVPTIGVSVQSAVTITAKFGSVSKTASLTVNPPAITSITIMPTLVSGGTSTTGAIKLSGPAPASGMLVKLSSSSGSATLPTSVTIGSGKNSGTFTVKTLPVASQTSVTLSAKLGAVSMTTTLTIQPPTVTSLSLNPTSVKGGASSVGTVTINSSAPTGGIVVGLSSSTPSATPPTTVTIPAGKTTATFSIKSKTVTATTTATITATSGGVSKVEALVIK